MKCRECGCTDEAACLVGDVPCFWVDPDLCSSCAPLSRVLEMSGGLGWVLMVCAGVSAEVERDASYAATPGDPAIFGTADECGELQLVEEDLG